MFGTQDNLWLLFQVLLMSLCCNEAVYLCHNLKTQFCSNECTATGFTLECPPFTSWNEFNSSVQLDVRYHEFANLNCYGQDIDYKQLNGSTVGDIETFSITRCPLPKASFKSLLLFFKIEGLKKLKIEYSLINVSFNDTYFDGIENITHLFLARNGFSELPITLLERTNLLTNLDLQDNNLNLETGTLLPLNNLEKLELGSNNIHTWTPGLFRNLNKLKLLNIWGNKLTNLSKGSFEGLENLTSLDISSNNITFLFKDTFSILLNLKILNLYKNNIMHLPEDIFLANKKLEEVKLLENTKLEHLPNKLFANLDFLRDINLRKCNISILPEDMLWYSPNILKIDFSKNSIGIVPKLLFKDTINLETLDLSDNQISALTENVFGSLSSLQNLYLKQNRLSSINEEVFHKLVSLKLLDLSNNQLAEVSIYAFQELINLKSLNLSHNLLTFQPRTKFSDDISSPLSRCSELETLDLSFNYISQMFNDWQWILMNLRELNLNHNNFTEITAHDLQFFQRPLYVHLQKNKISAVNLNLLELISSQNDNIENSNHGHALMIDLGENKFICNCDIYNVLKYQERLMKPIVYNTLKIKFQGSTCEDPPPLSGYPISQLNTHTFRCPKTIGQECPDNCQCENWISKMLYIVNCTQAGLKALPRNFDKLATSKLPIALILENNSLNSMSFNGALEDINVTILSLANNHISSIDSSALPTTLKELRLHNNDITRLDISFLESMTNATNLTLHNNPLVCDCEAMDLLNFLHASYKQVEHINNITCSDGRILHELTADELCPSSKMMIVVASTTVAIVGIIIGLLAALYFRYQTEIKVWLYAHNMCLWFVTEEDLDKDKIYDAFISYSHKDEDFVANKLLPNLENSKPAYKICIHYRDWIVGEFITTQIARSVEDSKRTIVILSENFIKSEWGRLEFRAAHRQALQEKTARVIMIVYGDLGPFNDLDCELRTYLNTNTYLKWGDPWFWDKLRYALPHQSKLPQKKNVMDKLELINSSSLTKDSTPPADITINPLEIIHNFPEKKNNLIND